MALKNEADELMLKVGRNVLLFQQLEKHLKYIVSVSSMSGYTSNIASKHEKYKESVGKRTLGMVARDFIDGPQIQELPDDPSEVYLSFSVNFELADGFVQEIESLVKERNALVHHFLDSVDFKSSTSLREAGNKLESQKQRLNKAIDDTHRLAQAVSDGRKEAFEQFASDFSSERR